MFLASQSSREQLETVRGGLVVRMRCLVVVWPLETAVCTPDEHACALTQMYFTCLSPVRLNELPLSVSLVWLRLPWFSWFGSLFPGSLSQSFQDVWFSRRVFKTFGHKNNHTKPLISLCLSVCVCLSLSLFFFFFFYLCFCDLRFDLVWSNCEYVICPEVTLYG